MSEISNQTTGAQGEELDDFDVEGHLIKEVALVAGILAGGAGAALAVDNPAPGTTNGVRAVVSGAYDDTKNRLTWSQEVTSTAVKAASTTLGDAHEFADRTGATVINAAGETLAPVVDDAGVAVGQATQLAGEAAEDPIGTTDREVDSAIKTVRDTRDDAIAAAKDAADTADRAAAAAITAAGETADDAVVIAQSTADGVYSTADPRAEGSVGPDGATVTVGAAGKSVTVQAG